MPLGPVPTAMDGRMLLAAIGSGVTTLLLVGAIVIEAVAGATGADVGPGIVGVAVGVLAALVALVLVVARWSRLSATARHLVLGYAAFGLAFLGLSALSYVNVPGARQVLSVPLNAGIALVVAVLVAAVSQLRTRR